MVEEILQRQDTLLRTLSLEKKKCFRHSCYRRQNVIPASCTVTPKTRLYCTVVIILRKRLSFSHTWCEQKEGFNFLSYELSPKTTKHVSENKGSKFSQFPQPVWLSTLNLINSGLFFFPNVIVIWWKNSELIHQSASLQSWKYQPHFSDLGHMNLF